MKTTNLIIILVSILVPTVVALLFFFISADSNLGSWVYQLPTLNAIINSTTAVLLIAALVAIKNGHEKTHRNIMLLAFTLGAIFLLSYITYHASVPSTVFGDLNHDHLLSEVELANVGSWRIFYLILLLAHILLAIIGLPLVLMAILYGVQGNRVAHRKIVRFTYPVWMFIAISGVIVYFLISPYY